MSRLIVPQPGVRTVEADFARRFWRPVKLLIGGVAALAVIVGGLNFIGTGRPPAGARFVAASAPPPKLDHAMPTDRVVSFMTATALAQVAALTLPPASARPAVTTRHASARPHDHVVAHRVALPAAMTILPPQREVVVAIVAPAVAAPIPPKLSLVDHLTQFVPTPEKLEHGIVWVGGAMGSLARKL